MPATYEPIATTTLGSAASTITFSSITSAYTDLRIIWTGTTSTALNVTLQFNGDTGSNWGLTSLYGTGAAAASIRYSNQLGYLLGLTSTTVPTSHSIDVFSYAGGTKKTVLDVFSGDFNGSGNVQRTVLLWNNTAAITSIALSAIANNFSIGTTATLYGILKA